MTEDGGEHVRLGADWLDRWLPELAADELKAYLELAHRTRERTYHEASELHAVLPGRSVEEIRDLLRRLEGRGLIEMVERDALIHYHFPHQDETGLHRAQPMRPPLVDALEAQHELLEELLDLASQDETPEVREEVFERHPALRDEYELYLEAREDDTPPWRLWMELSMYLISRFEERYGSLKEEHGQLFKETSAELLRFKLDLLDQLVEDVLSRPGDVFRDRGEGWAAPVSRSEFARLPFVRRMTRRSHVGAEQIYLHLIEVLGSRGVVVCELDEEGRLRDLLLPSTTGLTPREEEIAFMTDGDGVPPDEVEEVRRRYAEHLARRAAETVRSFAREDRVDGVERLLETIARRTDETLSTTGGGPSVDPPFVRRIYEQTTG